jgi:hypothetical protein
MSFLEYLLLLKIADADCLLINLSTCLKYRVLCLFWSICYSKCISCRGVQSTFMLSVQAVELWIRLSVELRVPVYAYTVMQIP